MKRISLYVMMFLIVFKLFLPLLCYGHGFDENTLVSIPDEAVPFYPIKFLCEELLHEKQSVVSFDVAKNVCVTRRVRSAGFSQTDCYCALRFNGESCDDIICTPEQEFFLLSTHQWVPAYKLQVGDLLLSKDKQLKKISTIQFFDQPRTVYLIQVKGTHNFFVGRHCILTHNIPLPAITLGLGFAFGSGATVGSGMGTVLGPITFSIGTLLGGLIGIGIRSCFGTRELPQYHFDVHTQALNQAFFTEQTPIKDIPKPVPATGKKEDAQAPGKPIKNGEVPKKQSDVEEEKNSGTKECKPRGLTNKEARKIAEKWGYKEDKNPPFDDHAKISFKHKKRNIWISPDRDCHNGGVWKEFAKNKRRTLDANGEPIGK